MEAASGLWLVPESMGSPAAENEPALAILTLSAFSGWDRQAMLRRQAPVV